MSQSIDNAFIKQYETEVKAAYQQQGSKFRGTVRLKSNVNGTDTTFQKVGKGSASAKSRHGRGRFSTRTERPSPGETLRTSGHTQLPR